MEKQFNDFAYQVFASRMFAIPDARLGWDAGVQAERERIRARAKIAAEKAYLIEQFVDALLEDGDAN